MQRALVITFLSNLESLIEWYYCLGTSRRTLVDKIDTIRGRFDQIEKNEQYLYK